MTDELKVGQQIQCKDDKGFLTPYCEQTPVSGRLYTIREIITKSTGPCLRLREIVNPPAHYAEGETECSFSATRFEVGVPSMPFFTVRGPLPISGGGGSPAWLPTYNSTELGPDNPITFTAAALGVVSATRITIVLAHCEITGQTGMTIGGLTATEAVHEFTGVSGLGIWYCDTHTLGTTADIIISASGTMGSNSIQVGQLINCSLAPTFTNSAAPSLSPSSLAITVPVGGIGIVGACTGNTVTGSGWTGATEDYTFAAADGTQRSLGNTLSSGTPSYSYTGAVSSHTVAAAWGA